METTGGGGVTAILCMVVPMVLPVIHGWLTPVSWLKVIFRQEIKEQL